jgi:uncharacterized surface protein with fasciclin (FAS1) repeats
MRSLRVVLAVGSFAAVACGPATESGNTSGAALNVSGQGQAAIADDESQKTIARIAAESKDHSTLVTALKAVNWVDALANPGPFTVFAPTNAAFEKLPPGTVETLLKPENAAKLRTILLHHVMTSAYDESEFTDGASLSMVDGGPTTAKRQGKDVSIDGANIVASVRGSNGWVYVVDAVILPAEKK